MTLADMAAREELTPLAPNRHEMERLMVAAKRRLEDAKNESVHPETRLEQAYDVILTCANVALRASGYRVARGEGQHVRTLETFGYSLAIDAERISYFQALRGMRHRGLYEGLREVTQSELDEAISEATELIQQTQDWLKDNYPQLIS